MSRHVSSQLLGVAPWVLALGLLGSVAGCDDNFLNVVNIEVFGDGAGSGTVTSREGVVPINCRLVAGMGQGLCEAEIEEAGAGGVTFLEAEPEPGSIFSGWQGCTQVNNDVCQLSFDAGADDVRFRVTATFEPDPSDPCNAAYGTSPGYVLCSQSETSCTFYTLLNDVDSCDTRCAGGGGTCLASLPDTDDTCVSLDEPGSCSDIVGDRLCECTKP